MKKIILVYILILPLFVFGQIDSIFGSYSYLFDRSGGFIKLFKNNTFCYKSPIDVGFAPITCGSLLFSGDTVYFSYSQPIDPEIIDSSSQYNPDHKNIIIKLTGISGEYTFASLYIKSSSKKEQMVPFELNEAVSIDSINSTDQLFIHIDNYTSIPITLNVTEKNEYFFKIQLPPDYSMYYLNERKALLKNGFMYFSMSEDGAPYYNTDVYKDSKDLKKIFEDNWWKFLNSTKTKQ